MNEQVKAMWADPRFKLYKTGVSTMNERTKQLWKESQQWNGSDDGRGGLKILESVDKFAELLIREYSYDVMDLNGTKPERVQYAAKCWGVEV